MRGKATVAKLHRWGLLDKVLAMGCPPVQNQVFDIGPFALTGSPPCTVPKPEFFAPENMLRIVDGAGT